MDRDAYKERQKARRVEAQRHEMKLVLGKLDALLDQANRDGMLRQQTTLSPWMLRGLVNSVRDLEAQLERAEAVGRQAERERCINICRGIKQEHNTMMNSLLECDMRFEGGASSAAERCADQIADDENTGDFTLDRLRRKRERAASREDL